MKDEKVIIPCSGGIVSTTLIYYLNEKMFTILPITFDWKQFKKTHALEGIKKVCKKLNLPLKIVDFAGIKDLLENANEDHTVIMNRDLIYLSIILSYALTIKCRLIYYPIYLTEPEQAPQIHNYAEMLKNMIETISGKKIHLAYDFIMNEEWELIQLADILGVDFDNTWSCVYNDKYHCGKCAGCTHRANSFYKANVKDPTKYQNPPLIDKEKKPDIFFDDLKEWEKQAKTKIERGEKI